MAKVTDNATIRGLLIIACLMIITAGLKSAGDMLAPLLIALFFTVLSIPPLTRLQKRGVPTTLAIAIVVLGATAAFLGIIAIIGNSLASFDEKLPEYQRILSGYMEGLLGWLETKGIQSSQSDLTNKLDSGAILELIRNLAGGLLNALSQIFLVLLVMVFMLVEAAGMPAKLRKALDRPDADLKDWEEAMVQVQKYVAIKAMISLVTGGLATLITLAFGVDFPLLWGLVAFLFNFIPNIGSVIAAIPPMLLALVQHGLSSSLGVGVGYLVINMVMGNMIEPKLMGRQLGLSTLVVFLSLIFWNWVWGPVGMVLSVPLTVIAKIILEHSAEFRWLAIMLGPVPEPSNEAPSSEQTPPPQAPT